MEKEQYRKRCFLVLSKKVLLLLKLAARTRDPLWEQLAHRIIQIFFF